MQRRHGSCHVRSILDRTVLEVRSLVRSLECWVLPHSGRMCVPRGFGEDVGELRGGMKAASTSPQVHALPQPLAAWVTCGASLSSVAAAGMAPLESH